MTSLNTLRQEIEKEIEDSELTLKKLETIYLEFKDYEPDTDGKYEEILKKYKEEENKLYHRSEDGCITGIPKEWLLKAKLELLNKIEPLVIEKKKVLDVLKNIENPYPSDIFKWDNSQTLDFTRGRFNQFCFEIIENFRKELKKELGVEE